jgi:heme-degrading monooxygenase HmoA
VVLRVVNAAVPAEKKPAYVDFVKNTLAPALRRMPGCRFVYVAECIEGGSPEQVIYVSGWDSLEAAESMEKGDVYTGAAAKVRTFYTDYYQKNDVPHLHYRNFAELN